MVHMKGDDTRAEYDFAGGVRGKHYRAMESGYTITIHKEDGTTITKNVMPKEGAVVLEPDIRAYFPDSESVNRALRCLIPLLQKKTQNKGKESLKNHSRGCSYRRAAEFGCQAERQ
ncbi:MAG: hypothetical protein AYP45_07940 [Candidatus Brocadia carolinensis]|uniref:Uncharacterized protein n=1 Tax=Candidatus Brocadia carolinensis TaxID=1004156 RepID=A0A1V4AU48_9BACT|nr:MAG: hypothetical protein AYP45_07940 [Candidatus Brocadia caroliniensis]